MDRPRERQRAGKAAINRESLTVDVGRLVACQEQRHGGDFLRRAGALQRVELPDLVLRTTLARSLEDRLGHTGFHQARTDRVDAHAGAEQRGGRGLREADDARLARAVGRAARIRAQSRNRRGEDDRIAALFMPACLTARNGPIRLVCRIRSQ